MIGNAFSATLVKPSSNVMAIRCTPWPRPGARRAAHGARVLARGRAELTRLIESIQASARSQEDRVAWDAALNAVKRREAVSTALELFKQVVDKRPTDIAAWEGVRTAAEAVDDVKAMAVPALAHRVILRPAPRTSASLSS